MSRRHSRAGRARGRGNEQHRPVFVDASGRRGRKFRRFGWILILASACCALMPVGVLVGGDSRAPWLPGLGRSDEDQADRVETRPDPGGQVETDAPRRAAPVASPPFDLAGAVGPSPSVSGSAADGSTTPVAPEPVSRKPAPAIPLPGRSSTPAPVASPSPPVDDGPETGAPSTPPAPTDPTPTGPTPTDTAPPEPVGSPSPTTEPVAQSSHSAGGVVCAEPLIAVCVVLHGV